MKELLALELELVAKAENEPGLILPGFSLHDLMDEQVLVTEGMADEALDEEVDDDVLANAAAILEE